MQHMQLIMIFFQSIQAHNACGQHLNFYLGICDLKATRHLKVAFFQKVRFVFLNLQKNLFQKNFKFQAQDSFSSEYFFLEIWRSKKGIALSEKKPPLAHRRTYINCDLYKMTLSSTVQR